MILCRWFLKLLYRCCSYFQSSVRPANYSISCILPCSISILHCLHWIHDPEYDFLPQQINATHLFPAFVRSALILIIRASPRKHSVGTLPGNLNEVCIFLPVFHMRKLKSVGVFFNPFYGIFIGRYHPVYVHFKVYQIGVRVFHKNVLRIHPV